MSSLRFVEKLAGSPWLCDQEHVEFLHGIFLSYMERVADGRPLDRQAVEQTLGRPLDNTRAVTVQNGVARIPVVGTIVRRANLFSDISGGVSTEAIAKDFATAYNDNTVHSILFVFDSPGGEATGINELASFIREKRELGEKRIEAYCDGDCASGAYWIASATRRITTDPTSAVGSIGVVSRVRNPEAAGKKLHLEFWNARSPKKRLDPSSYEGQAAIQEYIDDMGDEFIRAVANNRGVSFEEVERDFGQGFVMTGRRAVEVGLADALGSEEEVMRRLGEQASVRSRGAANTRLEVAEMTQTQIDPDETTEQNAEGILSRIRAMLGGPGVTGGESDEHIVEPKRNENEGRTVKLEERDGAAVLVSQSGETLKLSTEDRDRLVSERDEELSAENERLRAELSEANERIEALSRENGATLEDYRTVQVDRELDGLRAEGVPTYLINLARPSLVVEKDNPDEAKRWRSVLTGAKDTVEYGERGSADAEAPSAYAEATERAKGIVLAEQKEGRKISISAARAQVWESDPALAARHRDEKEGSE